MTEQELQSLLQHVDGYLPAALNCLVIVDSRQSPPRCCEVYFRPWWHNGHKLVPAMFASAQRLVDKYAEPCRQDRCGVVLLGQPDSGLALELCQLNYFHCLPAASLSEPMEEAERGAPEAPLKLEIEAERTISFASTLLPRSVTARLPSDGSRQLLCVRAGDTHAGQQERPLPGPQWFQLSNCPAVVHLAIDIQPGTDTDQWEVRSESPAKVSRVPAPARRSHPLHRLIVVFDRTCPDNNHWSDARNRLMPKPIAVQQDLRALEQQFMNSGSSAQNSPAPAPADSLGDFNQEIRQGLADFLTESFANSPIEVNTIWVADTADRILDWPPGISVVCESSVGELPEWTSSHAARELRSLTFSPGLDIWDPLEDALTLALKQLQRTAEPETAVLLVGNSPPNPPLEPESPFWNILRLDNGRIRSEGDRQPYTSTFRARRRSNFHGLLEEIKARGVPVAMLFLTHSEYAAAHQPQFELYQQVQKEVLSAFQQCLTKVERAQADRASVRSGLLRLLPALEQPPLSRVSVERL